MDYFQGGRLQRENTRAEPGSRKGLHLKGELLGLLVN